MVYFKKTNNIKDTDEDFINLLVVKQLENIIKLKGRNSSLNL
jgi:hypothetical protein